jgi:CheY-like chemotaxis protein
VPQLRALSLPLYQHPSLTVLVGASEASLARLQCELGDTVNSKALTDPHTALAWLQANDAATRPEPLVSAGACVQQLFSVALDLGQIFRLAFQPGRFMLPSVLVVDCCIGAMNGIDLCARLAALPCKKILLCGAGDGGAALDAFNRGLIDRAIRKSDNDALDQLARAIASLQQQYFADLSTALGAALAVTLHGLSFLADQAIARLVRELSLARGFVEHYLYPQPGGLLLFDAAGRATLMVIETEQGMDTHHEVARDSGAPPSLLEAIEARCVVPFFRHGDGMYDAGTVGERWYRDCAPAQVCEGEQRYFWALFDIEADELPQAAAPFARFRDERRRLQA